MLFVGDLNNRELSDSLGNLVGAKTIYPEKHIFDDGEVRIRILESVLDADVYVLKSISPPVDSNLLEFLFIVDSLKRSGARSVTAIIPYLGYSRADHVFRAGEGVPLEVVIKSIEAVGLDEIILVDPHTIKLGEMFKIRVRLESALPLFSEKIKDLGLPFENLSIVSPDMGGIRRVKMLSEMLPGSTYAAVNKDRDLATGELSGSRVAEGELREICIITDDIISTGKTMVNSVELCRKEGARSVYVFASQGVFSSDAHRILSECSADKIYITDAIPLPMEKRFEKLEILTLGPTIAKLLL